MSQHRVVHHVFVLHTLRLHWAYSVLYHDFLGWFALPQGLQAQLTGNSKAPSPACWCLLWLPEQHSLCEAVNVLFLPAPCQFLGYFSRSNVE